MTYEKKIWTDQNVERPKTYEFTNNADGSVTLTESFGNVVDLGTPVNAANMNHIENGLADTDVTKYNALTTYATGEWVTGTVDNKKGIYTSKVDNNTGNALSDADYWEEVQLGGGARNIGEIVTSTIPLIDAGLHLLDGSLLDGNGAYGAFVDYISGLITDYPDLFETEANWQTSVTNYGVCGKFVYNSVNNTVRLPKITGFIEGTTDLTALGDLVEAGLPNITAKFALGSSSTASGAVYISGGTGGESGGSGGIDEQGWFDASRSSSIYGNSITVQPQTIKVLYYIVIATTSKTEIEVDIDEISTDLNGKADIDLSNMNPSQSAKDAIINWGMPDYDAMVDITSAVANGYTASYTQYIMVCCYKGAQQNSTAFLTINNVDYSIAWTSTNNQYNINNSLFIVLNKNDTLSVNSTNAVWSITAYPLKGGNYA